MSQIRDIYTADEFEDLLFQAESQASTPFEIDFTSTIRDRYELFGIKAYLSESLDDLLNNIANND